MAFYSARLLFIILVADGPGKKRNQYDERVIVFRAESFDQAFQHALELGLSQETDYLNDKQQRVRWVLAEIVALDWIGRSVDGKEVSSVLHYRTSKVPVLPDQTFHPEASQPHQSF